MSDTKEVVIDGVTYVPKAEQPAPHPVYPDVVPGLEHIGCEVEVWGNDLPQENRVLLTLEDNVFLADIAGKDRAKFWEHARLRTNCPPVATARNVWLINSDGQRGFMTGWNPFDSEPMGFIDTRLRIFHGDDWLVDPDQTPEPWAEGGAS